MPRDDTDPHHKSLPVDVSTAGAISLGLVGTFLATLFGGRFAAPEAYRPIVSWMMLPGAGLLLFAVMVVALRHAGWLPKRSETWLHIMAMAAVPILMIYSAREFGALDAATFAQVACERTLVSEVDEATQRQTNTKSTLRRCKAEFEEKRPLFSSITVEKYCATQQRSANSAAQEVKAAGEKVCVAGIAAGPAPATTGSVR
jgi:hypothetical protein